MITNMIYNSEKNALCATVDGMKITISFAKEHPETCIWHYVFKNLGSEDIHGETEQIE